MFAFRSRKKLFTVVFYFYYSRFACIQLVQYHDNSYYRGMHRHSIICNSGKLHDTIEIGHTENKIDCTQCTIVINQNNRFKRFNILTPNIF